MEITSWGTRGSIPTSGVKFHRYGGNTTCFQIITKVNNLILIDAGSGIRIAGKKILKNSNIKEINLLLTHAHWDHLMGFPFFIPAYEDKYTIHVRGGKYAKSSLQKYLKHQMEPPYFPVNFNLLKANFNFKKNRPSMFSNDNIKIESINLNHPDGGFGYRFTEDNKVFVFLTDNELDFHHKHGPDRETFVNFCRNADLLIHDAQYTDKEYKKTIGWGHSTYSSCIQLAIDAGVKNLGFCHHDPDRCDDDLDTIVEKYQKEIISQGLQLNCFGVKEGVTLKL